MILNIIGSGSSGNCYILENETEILIIECGVSFKKINEAINFNVKKVVGVLITHEHGDHCKSSKQVVESGINIYSSNGTFEKLKHNSHRFKALKINEVENIGGFKVLAFDVVHDAKQPIGFLISHEETGNFLYLTDTNYLPHKFKNLHNIIIECNYSDDIIEEQSKKGTLPKFVYERTKKSHLSFNDCKTMLLENELKNVNNIVLIHLSDGNSNAKQFQEEIQNATRKTTFIAEKNLKIDFNKEPF